MKPNLAACFSLSAFSLSLVSGDSQVAQINSENVIEVKGETIGLHVFTVSQTDSVVPNTESAEFKVQVCSTPALKTAWAPSQQTHAIYQSDNEAQVTQSESPSVLTIESPFESMEPGCFSYELLKESIVFAEASVHDGPTPNTLLVTVWSTDLDLVTGDPTLFSVRATSLPQLQSVQTLVSEHKIAIKVLCSTEPSLTLTTTSAENSIKVGEYLNVPITITKKPQESKCWPSTRLSLVSQAAVPITSQSLSLTFPNGASAALATSRSDQVGEHSLKIQFQDLLSSKKAELTVKVSIASTGGYVNCDATQLYLEPNSEQASSLPSSTLEVEVNGATFSYILPVLKLKALTNINAAACGSVVPALRAKDSSGKTIAATFAQFVVGSSQLTIRASTNEQAGDYSLELHGALDTYSEVTLTIQLFEVVITPEAQTNENPTATTAEQTASSQQAETPSGQFQSNATSQASTTEQVTTNSIAAVDSQEGTKSNESQAEEPPKKSQVFKDKVKLPYEVRFKPSFELPSNQGPLSSQITVVHRIYATCKISEISPLGLMTLKMNETVVVHDDYGFVTLQDFEVEFKQNSDEQRQELTFQIVSVTEEAIEVQLSFEQPLFVSQGKVSDQIVVKLNKDLFLIPQRFEGISTVKRVDAEPYRVISEELPKLAPSEEELEKISSISGKSSWTIVIMIVLPLVAGTLLKGVLAKLWGMLGTFQLINALSLVSVSVPTNVMTTQEKSNDVINFQPIPKDIIAELIFGPSHEDYPDSVAIGPPPEESDDEGNSNTLLRQLTAANDSEDEEESLFEIGEASIAARFNPLTKSFSLSQEQIMKAMQVLGLAVAGCAGLIIVVCALKPMCRCAQLAQLCRRIQNMLMFNSILRYFMMTFLSISVGCARQLRRAAEHINDIEAYQSILALCLLVAYMLFTIFLTCLVLRNQSKLKDENFKQKYGTLYTPCDTDKGRSPLYFILVFCGRRWLIAISVSLFTDEPLVQLTFAQVMCTLVLLWLIQVWPMENKRQNMLYILNEYLYLTTAFFMMGFSSYNFEPETRYETGWFYIGFLGGILAINVFIMLIDVIFGIKLSCKKRKYKKRVQKELANRRQRRLELRKQQALQAEAAESSDQEVQVPRKSRRKRITVVKQGSDEHNNNISDNSIQEEYLNQKKIDLQSKVQAEYDEQKKVGNIGGHKTNSEASSSKQEASSAQSSCSDQSSESSSFSRSSESDCASDQKKSQCGFEIKKVQAQSHMLKGDIGLEKDFKGTASESSSSYQASSFNLGCRDSSGVSQSGDNSSAQYSASGSSRSDVASSSQTPSKPSERVLSSLSIDIDDQAKLRSALKNLEAELDQIMEERKADKKKAQTNSQTSENFDNSKSVGGISSFAQLRQEVHQDKVRKVDRNITDFDSSKNAMRVAHTALGQTKSIDMRTTELPRPQNFNIFMNDIERDIQHFKLEGDLEKPTQLPARRQNTRQGQKIAFTRWDQKQGGTQ